MLLPRCKFLRSHIWREFSIMPPLNISSNDHANMESRVHKVVLTGGPCAGKTTGQTRLTIFFENLGWKVYRVPETATVLLSGGVKYDELNQLQAYKFQENFIKTLMSMEQSFFDLASASGRDSLVVCDRGVMDCSAYLQKDDWERMLKTNGWNEVELRDTRYQHVVHLVSAAHGAEPFYTTDDHLVRSEDIDGARDLDQLTSQAWVGHPCYNVVDNEHSEDFNTKINRMIKCVCTRLGIDAANRLAPSSRKRKFIVKNIPAAMEFPRHQDITVIHDYLVTPNRQVQARLRKRGQNDHWTYTHTIRRPEISGQRVELKSNLTARDYNALLAQADENHFTIHKTRRCFLWENQYYLMDVYEQPCHPRCKGLVMLETYTSIHDDRLKLPPFLEVVAEVTDITAYSMYNLSRRDERRSSEALNAQTLVI